MGKESLLKTKSFDFAIRVIKLKQYLRKKVQRISIIQTNSKVGHFRWSYGKLGGTC